MVARKGLVDERLSTRREDEVIEVTLLLSNSRLEALLDLSRDRGQTVGQILRDLIERELSVTNVAC